MVTLNTTFDLGGLKTQSTHHFNIYCNINGTLTEFRLVINVSTCSGIKVRKCNGIYYSPSQILISNNHNAHVPTFNCSGPL